MVVTNLLVKYTYERLELYLLTSTFLTLKLSIVIRTLEYK